MPKLIVEKKSSLKSAEAFQKVKNTLSEDRDLKKLDSGFHCVFDEKTLSGTANGNMFKAAISVREEAEGSSVQIIVELPFTLALVKGFIESTLKKKLDQSLA